MFLKATTVCFRTRSPHSIAIEPMSDGNTAHSTVLAGLTWDDVTRGLVNYFLQIFSMDMRSQLSGLSGGAGCQVLRRRLSGLSCGGGGCHETKWTIEAPVGA